MNKEILFMKMMYRDNITMLTIQMNSRKMNSLLHTC